MFFGFIPKVIFERTQVWGLYEGENKKISRQVVNLLEILFFIPPS